jgi:hypothetical protein
MVEAIIQKKNGGSLERGLDACGELETRAVWAFLSFVQRQCANLIV